MICKIIGIKTWKFNKYEIISWNINYNKITVWNSMVSMVENASQNNKFSLKIAKLF